MYSSRRLCLSNFTHLWSKFVLRAIESDYKAASEPTAGSIDCVSFTETNVGGMMLQVWIHFSIWIDNGTSGTVNSG